MTTTGKTTPMATVAPVERPPEPPDSLFESAVDDGAGSELDAAAVVMSVGSYTILSPYALTPCSSVKVSAIVLPSTSFANSTVVFLPALQVQNIFSRSMSSAWETHHMVKSWRTGQHVIVDVASASRHGCTTFGLYSRWGRPFPGNSRRLSRC